MSEIERAIEQGEWRLQLINAMRPNGAGGVGMVQCTEIWRQNDEEQFIESALTVLRAELEREKNPMTWNERINQMTVEELADFVPTLALVNERARRYASKRSPLGHVVIRLMKKYTRKFLNSPYTEGEME